MTLHFSPDELFALAFDATDLTAAADHLASCATCRQQVEELQLLATDLTIARLSAPRPAALDRYSALFVNVQQQPSRVQRFVEQMHAVLTWDSRHQPALQGVRSGADAAYRQLYAADEVEVELMVERSGRLRRVEGDLIAGDQERGHEPALVELVDPQNRVVHWVETDADNLFRLEDIAPGMYRAVITRPRAATIVVEALEIA
ncbi:MAG: carboxypeptidase-like regulatory domain-containing protein [Caldilinea sp.]|uniref:carboxypeptidase-like regulatory domain-containing protein n=1 Tax=Caldilinea sp. TaxID=2293560 RepID=UPI002BFB43A5|nr:carboxypeptidase regulatory-like domain-containing protein [Anaerolineales bacterium]HQY93427.1 carboxypeptidase-like regulatory domain-containing protein [Caldilinea sp.]